MSAWNSARCSKCGHIGNKCNMVRDMKDGFVSGYHHEHCEEYRYCTTEVKDALSDANYSNRSDFTA